MIDPDQVVDELEQIITDRAAAELKGRIGGVALDTFASSVVGVDGDGRAVTPCYTYADSRCGAQVVALRRELDEAEVQQRTGCRLHSSYLPARLRWLHEADPARFGSAQRWLSLGEYAYLRLLGTTAAGTATAAWTGLLDRRTGRWDPQMLKSAGHRGRPAVRGARPGPAPDRCGWPGGTPAGRHSPMHTGSHPSADGFSSNLGTGADDETTAAVAAATSGAIRVLVSDIPERIPAGLWCYRVDARRQPAGRRDQRRRPCRLVAEQHRAAGQTPIPTS